MNIKFYHLLFSGIKRKSGSRTFPTLLCLSVSFLATEAAESHTAHDKTHNDDNGNKQPYTGPQLEIKAVSHVERERKKEKKVIQTLTRVITSVIS